MSERQRCQRCGCFVKRGADDQLGMKLCEACTLGEARKLSPRLMCDCGKPAVTRLEVRIGRPENEFTAVLNLCEECWKLEQEMGLK